MRSVVLMDRELLLVNGIPEYEDSYSYSIDSDFFFLFLIISWLYLIIMLSLLQF